MKQAGIIFIALCGCADNTGASATTQQLCTSTGGGGNGCCPGSPIIVDMAGDGVHLTSAAEGVIYTFRSGKLGLWAWTRAESDDAFLVLDVNSNGRIDDGSEMFGDGSIQVLGDNDPNGFAALAYYDLAAQGGNGDGTIDHRDAVWPRLRLWRDYDHDAFSAESELTTLDKAGVHSFSLAAMPSRMVDEYGNESRFVATIVADAPVSMIVSDVWLTQVDIPVDSSGLSDFAPDTTTTWTCYSWAYAQTGTGPNNPSRGPCDNVPTANDPIATTSGGSLAKLVARYAVDSSKSAAMSRASNTVFNAVNYTPTGPSTYVCLGSGFPNPDSYYQPPYDDDGNEYTLPIRTKCFSQTTTTGGGGDGC